MIAVLHIVAHSRDRNSDSRSIKINKQRRARQQKRKHAGRKRKHARQRQRCVIFFQFIFIVQIWTALWDWVLWCTVVPPRGSSLCCFCCMSFSLG